MIHPRDIPTVERYATHYGVPLDRVPATGRDGTHTHSDVFAAVSARTRIHPARARVGEPRRDSADCPPSPRRTTTRGLAADELYALLFGTSPQ